MLRRRVFLSLTASIAAIACGGDPLPCVRDSECERGFFCEATSAGARGTCVACGTSETVYDGLDNDCDPSTRDLDLDLDGDNAASSRITPGGDCDDRDPEVSSIAREVCGDSKDNDCDLSIDEIECGDELPPAVRFVSPADGAPVLGTITVEIEATDDVGVAQVELFVGDRPRLAMQDPPWRFILDTSSLQDGRLTLRAVATDVADKQAEASIAILVDNRSGPRIELRRPAPNGSFGGRLTFEIDAVDAAGVREVRLAVDGGVVLTATTGPFRAQIDTSSLADGLHALSASATDNTGAVSTSTLAIRVDNTAPTATITPANLEVSGTIAVRIAAVDESPIRSIESRGFSAAGMSMLSYALDTTALPNGPLTITATITDQVSIDDGARTGQVGIATARVIVYNAAGVRPMVQLTSPADGELVYRSAPFTAVASSPASIERVEFLVEGQVFATDTTSPYAASYDFSREVGMRRVAVRAIDRTGLSAIATATVTVVRPATFRVPGIAVSTDRIGTSNVAIGDLDDDGLPDVAYAGSGLSVAQNRGGWFGTATRVARNPGNAVAIGDMNADGLEDLVLLRPSTFEIWTHAGQLNFPQSRSVATGIAQASGLAVGDLDRDGDLDVVIGRSSGGDVVVMLQQNGSFASGVPYGQVGGVSQVVLADVDDDMDLDLVLGRQGSGADYATVYRNGGSGVFGAGQDTILGGRPESVAVADVSGDGYPDLVSAIRQPSPQSRISFALGNPNTPGSFVQGFDLAVNEPSGVAIADLDSDGSLDVVATSAEAHTVQVIERVAPGQWGASATYVVGRGARHPVVADLDADQDTDLVVTSPLNEAIAIVLNRGPDDLIAPPNLAMPGAPSAIALGALGGDGRPDPLVAYGRVAQLPPRVQRWIQQGGGFAAGSILALRASGDFTQLAIGDLDGAGGPDFAAGSAAAGGATASGFIVRDDGSGTVRTSTIYDPAPRSVAIGDVDMDGQAEVVFSFDVGNPTGPVDGARVYGPLGALERSLTAGSGSSGILIGLLDGDSMVDVAVANAEGDDIALFTIAGAMDNRRIFSGFPGVASLVAGRLGPAPVDTLNDLIGVGTAGIGYWLGNAAFDFETPLTFSAGAQPTRIVSADFNGDGISDVAVLNAGSDRVAALLGRANGGFFEADFLDVGELPSDVAVGDLDLDGRPDLVVSVRGVPALTFVYNDN